MPTRPPVSLTSLVGRERDIRDLGALVEAQRLVTVTGVGGSGKTRVAAELALRLDWNRPDSVVWVELGSCNEAPVVAQQVATALSIRAMRESALVDAIVDAIGDRAMLLVVDDCDPLIGAVAALAQTLLVRCPKIRILATSREPLGIPGEHIWPVPPISPQDAVQLFAERAAAVDPTFAITRENRDAVTEVCRKLDGMPLAIELAAARVRVLTPAQITEKLCDRFAILTGGARTAIPRHRTLRAAIDWSFALLDEREQTLLARLSVFAGSFSLEMAEKVCDADLDLLTGLVEKSLVATSYRRTGMRYYLLETIRQYAAERLEAAEESNEIRRRHAHAILALARAIVVDPMGDILGRLEALDTEHDNIRIALAWSIANEPDATALPLGAALRWYWYYRVLWSEGMRWLSRVLQCTSAAVSRERAAVLAGAGACAGYVGDLAAGRPWLEEAEAMWRQLGEDRELALTLSALSQLLANSGDLDAAAGRAAEAVELARRSGTRWDLGYCLINAMAFVAERRGDLDAADEALREAESIWSPMKHPLGLPFVLNQRAMIALRRNDHASAAKFAREALTVARPHADRWFAARSLRILAFTSTSDLVRAARLLGAADAMLRALGAGVLLHEKDEHERLMAAVSADALREGREMSFDEACDLALEGGVLQIHDLGPLQISVADTDASQRARELLAFLAAHPAGPTKEEVGVAFWPDASAEQVKNSFHVTLHRLRKMLGGSDTVAADGARYRIAIPYEADSQRFESSMTAALRSGDASAIEGALALYQGDFLQGEEAGEWCLPIRARLRQLQIRGLFALGQAHESRGRYTDAAEAYTRALARDPFHEAAARQLMICNARLGARSESLLVYRQLEERLRNDLQAAPEPETRSLYERLVTNR